MSTPQDQVQVQVTTTAAAVTTPVSQDAADDIAETVIGGNKFFSPRFLSTKFLLAFIFTVITCVALLMKIIGGDIFCYMAGIVLTGHGAVNIIDKKLNPSQP